MRKNDRRTWKLALSYLGVIMLISLLFSGIIYAMVATQLNRPMPKRDWQQASDAKTFETHILERNNETRSSVLLGLAGLNGAVLLSGAVLSYLLARWTLQPIEEAFERQARFISDASHELRTPLTALQITNEVALRKKQLDTTKTRAILEKNINEVDKMRQLIDNMLQLAKMETSVSKTTVKIDKLVSEIVETYQPSADARQVKITTQIPAQNITTHEAVVAQILKILLDNAIKYSKENGEVIIAYKDGKISVRDSGVGIASSELPHIFDRFYRSNQARTRSDQNSYGLGLAIAKNLCQQYAFKLSVTSKLGKGTTFWLNLT